jgi:uncharacterized protein (TIGR02172 family)
MTVEKGPMIAKGRTAEVFARGDEQVLKLFLEGFPAAVVQREAQVTEAVHKAGLPVPAVEGVVEVDGRVGIVFERVEGPTMLEDMMNRPWKLAPYAQIMAELQAEMHSREIATLPSLREDLEEVIQNQAGMPDNVRHALVDALRLPDGNSVLHGDFHPENIIISSRGPVIIDWMDAKRGNPLADAARTWLLLRMGAPTPGTKMQWLIKLIRRWFYLMFIKHYRELRPYSEQDMAAWRVPIVAARLFFESIPEERRDLMMFLESHLERQ